MTKNQKQQNCNHNFESVYGGFSHESGHWNYSVCSECGLETRSHKHGDWEDMNNAISEAISEINE